MQTLGRVLLSQLRPQVSQSSPALTAAAVAAGGWLSSIRFFSSEGSQRLYIGNLSFEATQEEIQQAFEKFGPVHVSLWPLAAREAVLRFNFELPVFLCSGCMHPFFTQMIICVIGWLYLQPA